MRDSCLSLTLVGLVSLTACQPIFNQDISSSTAPNKIPPLQVSSPVPAPVIAASTQPSVAPLTESSMTDEQVAALTPQAIAKLTTADIQGLTLEQMSIINNEQLKLLLPSQVSALAPEQLFILSAEQMSTLSQAQLQAITPENIAALSMSQLHAIDPENLAALSPEQLEALCGETEPDLDSTLTIASESTFQIQADALNILDTVDDDPHLNIRNSIFSPLKLEPLPDSSFLFNPGSELSLAEALASTDQIEMAEESPEDELFPLDDSPFPLMYAPPELPPDPNDDPTISLSDDFLSEATFSIASFSTSSFSIAAKKKTSKKTKKNFKDKKSDTKKAQKEKDDADKSNKEANQEGNAEAQETKQKVILDLDTLKRNFADRVASDLINQKVKAPAGIVDLSDLMDLTPAKIKSSKLTPSEQEQLLAYIANTITPYTKAQQAIYKLKDDGPRGTTKKTKKKVSDEEKAAQKKLEKARDKAEDEFIATLIELEEERRQSLFDSLPDEEVGATVQQLQTELAQLYSERKDIEKDIKKFTQQIKENDEDMHELWGDVDHSKGKKGGKKKKSSVSDSDREANNKRLEKEIEKLEEDNEILVAKITGQKEALELKDFAIERKQDAIDTAVEQGGFTTQQKKQRYSAKPKVKKHLEKTKKQNKVRTLPDKAIKKQRSKHVKVMVEKKAMTKKQFQSVDPKELNEVRKQRSKKPIRSTKKRFSTKQTTSGSEEVSTIQLLDYRLIQALTEEQVAGLEPAWFAELTPWQVKYLSPEIISLLTPQQVAALAFNELLPVQLQELSETQLNGLKTSQLLQLGSPQLNGLEEAPYNLVIQRLELLKTKAQALATNRQTHPEQRHKYTRIFRHIQRQLRLVGIAQLPELRLLDPLANQTVSVGSPVSLVAGITNQDLIPLKSVVFYEGTTQVGQVELKSGSLVMANFTWQPNSIAGLRSIRAVLKGENGRNLAISPPTTVTFISTAQPGVNSGQSSADSFQGDVTLDGI